MKVQGTSTSWSSVIANANNARMLGVQMYKYYTGMFHAGSSIWKEQGLKGLNAGCHQDAVRNVTKDMLADNGEIHVTRNCGLDCKDVEISVDATELVHDDGGFGERRDECVHDEEDHKYDVAIKDHDVTIEKG